MVTEAAEDVGVGDDTEPMTSTDAVRMWELEQMSLPEPTMEKRGITWERALDRLHHSDVSEARRWGMCDENANMCRDIIAARIAELEAENRELKMQAIADHAQFQEAVERLPDVTDPIAVHRNMLAGTIAKPSVEAIIHVYGHKSLNAALRETDGAPPPALTDIQPKGSETP